MSFALLTTVALLVAPPSPMRDCAYGATTPISQGSTFADQLRCYQTSGRRISVAGTSYTEGVVSNGYCVKGVGTDRVQVGRCTSAGSDPAITIPFTNIAYLTDNPDQEYVVLYLNGKIGG
jgi:hypothetical protein